MKFEFPDTGEGVTEGQFLEWKVEEGDEVDEDQIVGEAETDKAVVDIPAPADGVVKELRASPGDNVKVGDVIMILNTDAETSREPKEPEDENDLEEDTTDNNDKASNNDLKDAVMGGEPSASSYDEEEEKEETGDNEGTSEPDSGDILALPKVRKLAEEEGVNLASLDIDERITEEDVLEASESGKAVESKFEPKDDEIESGSQEPETTTDEQIDQDMSDVKARPSVRKLARKHDIEISMLEGSGRNGEITREDVFEAAGEAESKETTENSEEESKNSEPEENKEENTETPKIEHEGDVERVEMSSVRKITAKRMTESKEQAAHVTHIEKADITKLVELRESVKGNVDAHLTYLPFIMKACVAGLKEHPNLNSELDAEHDEIIQKNFYDFNIAVDTEKGLLVPKIENIDGKNMIELAQDIGDKASRAQNGELDRDEMEPGTFSITNLGVIGGEAFTPIIYPPQSAIMGIGKIQETAEVVDGEITPRKTVKLSLSYDHRVVDGAEAARFMNKVVKDLENPRNLIIDM